MTVNSWATPRWVTGIPRRAGTEIAEVSPGTTVTGTSAAAQASSSSKPRPKTKLSPPLKRTTRLPARARSTITSLMASWVAERPRGSLATSISSTWGPSSSSSSRGARRSATTTSAEASACRAATVTKSGSPGPPPTSTTPGVRSWASAAVRWPSRSAVTMSSRSAADLRGSRLPSTPTVTLPWWPTAGVQADPPRASSARTQKVCRASAAAATRALTSGSSVTATTYHAPSRSDSVKSRRWRRQLARETLERGSHLGADEGDLGARGEEGRHPALGDVTAADDDHLATGQHEAGQVGMGVGHVPIVPFRRVDHVARFEG